MGIIKYENGVFDLLVSFDYQASDVEKDDWKQTFEAASQRLYRAAKLQFGQINFTESDMPIGDLAARVESAADAPVDSAADAVLHNEGDFAFTEGIQNPYIPNDGIVMYLGNRRDPSAIHHEFGHYALALDDEYRGSMVNTTYRCAEQGDDICVMGLPDGFDPGCYCTETTCAEQETSYHGLTWAFYLSQYGDTLTVFPSVSPTDFPNCGSIIEKFFPEAEVATDTNECRARTLPQDSRFRWHPVDSREHIYLALPPEVWEELGIFPYFDGSKRRLDILKRAPVPPLPTFNLRGTLEYANRDVENVNRDSKLETASPIIIVASTTKDQGAPVDDDLYEQLTANRVRVFAFGTAANRDRLREVAERTKGRFYEVRGGDNEVESMRQHVLDLRDQLWAGSPVFEASSDVWRGDQADISVEQGSLRLKFILKHTPKMEMPPTLTITDPDGNQFSAKDGHPAWGYQTLVFYKPTTGDWQAEVNAAESCRFTLSAYSKNPQIRIGVGGAWATHRLGATAPFYFVVSATPVVVALDKSAVNVPPMPVVALDESVVNLRSPSGETRRLQLRLLPHGMHAGAFTADQVGAYDVELMVRNDGKAQAAAHPRRRKYEDKKIVEFQRVKRFQIHVRE